MALVLEVEATDTIPLRRYGPDGLTFRLMIAEPDEREVAGAEQLVRPDDLAQPYFPADSLRRIVGSWPSRAIIERDIPAIPASELQPLDALLPLPLGVEV